MERIYRLDGEPGGPLWDLRICSISWIGILQRGTRAETLGEYLVSGGGD